MIVIPDMAKKGSETTMNEFDDLVQPFLSSAETSEEGEQEEQDLAISESELLAHREKTNRHIRLRELLQENSKEASLVVMTLPMLRKNTTSSPLYMAWLEMMTKDMPPFLFVRGNQTSVLTYYS
ncbi:UNVERIFIED_CONTAM: hypothetical protein GTU68_046654 [Idotea baltica]|nr:hypothetical protein [Idotea baltica]